MAAALIKETLGGRVVESVTLQSLWSGYGSLKRLKLTGCQTRQVIVKEINLRPSKKAQPRGWNSDFSHQRKLRSYEVESNWYQQLNHLSPTTARTPDCYAATRQEDRIILLLEDLSAAGYPESRSELSLVGLRPCIRWLAAFHGRFMGKAPEGLWPVGTYWHLDTRPEEWAALTDPALKQAAQPLDQKLRQSPFQTLVHGDAKLANFCFSPEGNQVAAVDFQYVGGGCGMKDLAYLVSSCFQDAACFHHEAEILDSYFLHLEESLNRWHPQISATLVRSAWQPLYRVAWADFYRFLKGWKPGHWKLHPYSESITSEVLESLTPESQI